MVSTVRYEIFEAIRDTLLEKDKAKLTYSELYNELVTKLTKLRKTNNKTSYRDFSSVLNHMVKENKLQKEDSKKRGTKVYYSLTASSRKEYQYEILGIDKSKEKLRKLYQLLFLYEVSKFGKEYLTEKQLANFLKRLSLSRNDLQPLGKGEALDYTVFRYRDDIGGLDPFHLRYATAFKPVKDIEILKLDNEPAGNGVLYIVTIPGFSAGEITHISKEDKYYYEMHDLAIRLDLTEEEVEKAFRSLEKARLIEPLQEYYGREIRYNISDKKLRELISHVWRIVKMKIGLIFIKFSIGDFDEKDKRWLTYLYGDDKVTEYVLNSWKINSELYRQSHPDYNDRIEEGRKFTRNSKTNIDRDVELLNEKFKSIMDEYDFPLSVIQEIIR